MAEDDSWMRPPSDLPRYVPLDTESPTFEVNSGLIETCAQLRRLLEQKTEECVQLRQTVHMLLDTRVASRCNLCRSICTNAFKICDECKIDSIQLTLKVTMRKCKTCSFGFCAKKKRLCGQCCIIQRRMINEQNIGMQ